MSGEKFTIMPFAPCQIGYEHGAAGFGPDNRLTVDYCHIGAHFRKRLVEFLVRELGRIRFRHENYGRLYCIPADNGLISRPRGTANPFEDPGALLTGG